MRNKYRFFAAMSACWFGLGAALAQSEAPLAIEQADIATDSFSTGTLEAGDLSLPTDLWVSSAPSTLEYLIDNLPTQISTPSLGEAMRRTLLSPGSAPAAASPSLGGKKLIALVRAGFVDEARTIASLSGETRTNNWVRQSEAIADLLENRTARACARGENLQSGREAMFWVKLRVLCYVQAGEADAAELTLGVLREQRGINDADDAFLSYAVTGLAPKNPSRLESALHYAIAQFRGMTLSPALLENADGGVLVAAVKNEALDFRTRLGAAQRAVAMGVMSVERYEGLLASAPFDVAQVADALSVAQTTPNDVMTDALLYQSIEAMSAPEFIRDKLERIALALSIAPTFDRAYALSAVYQDEIRALEGVLATPTEARQFAIARMAAGDAVGAGQWLGVSLGANESISSFAPDEAMSFIEIINLFTILDPQSAAQIARAADVSLVGVRSSFGGAGLDDVHDPAIAANILEAAFDAALDQKVGQAGLAALAASTVGGGEEQSVIVGQSLRAAGMNDLRRRYKFERAWSTMFDTLSAQEIPVDEDDDDGLAPSLKPAKTN